ncbi:pyrroline-5-carboxylate reductase [Uliginosibacterium sp. H3]|uniref:Pyrroline-5-carboxylate reductase n=1 Tax=Uliginosibacterium silvisoli TaxID=3114758 RepID=A0ABU6K2I2_9RHOO|nr:pyrroline-5-carboxylate reductase [Uliginosibacterium sp. H3]
MKITFLGGGNMASALIGGMLKQGFAANEIQVVELFAAGRERLQTGFGVRTTETLDAQALDCDVLVLAVKPQQMRAALAPAAGKLVRQLVVSIAAGLRLQDLSRWLGGYSTLVRAMPNTPALIGLGITGLYAEESVAAEGREAVDRIMRAVGKSVWLDSEAQMDAVTAISGSGPAYVFYFIEALQAAGEKLGLAAETSRALALETFIGAATLAVQSDEPASVLRERVTSKGGTTAAALQSMAADALPDLIARATRAAALRGGELGNELGQD